MKKILAIVLALILAFSLFGCSSNSTTTADTSTAQTQTETTETSAAADDGFEGLRELFAKIPALETKVTLNVSTTAGVYHNFFGYIANTMGGLESVGVEVNMVDFPNGPLQVEAISSGDIDCGGYGVGGILSGCVGGITTLVDYRLDEAPVQKFFVKADSAIAKSGLNEFGFYGTAEDWKGAEVYLPAGTTLQYLMGSAMEKLGLTLEDLNVVYTEASNIYTVLASGQGDAWGLWNMTAYDESLQDGYVEAINGRTGGINLMAATVVGRHAMEDEQKVEAIKRWYACQEAVVIWMNESKENMDLAIDAMYQWCQDEGVTGSYGSISTYLNDIKPWSLEENQEYFTETNEDGLLKAKAIMTGAMDFFVSNSSYTVEDYEKLYDDANYTTEFIDYAISIFN